MRRKRDGTPLERELACPGRPPLSHTPGDGHVGTWEAIKVLVQLDAGEETKACRRSGGDALGGSEQGATSVRVELGHERHPDLDPKTSGGAAHRDREWGSPEVLPHWTPSLRLLAPSKSPSPMPGFPLARGSVWAGGRDHTPSRVPQRWGTTSCREAAPLTYDGTLSLSLSLSAVSLPLSPH